MTGGQDVTGLMDVPAMTRALEAEGVRQDRGLRRGPEALRPPRALGRRACRCSGATGSRRSRRSCASVPGVTVIVYDQRCAAEARRLRKSGELEEPPRRVVINEAVCEGCGDCSTKSNCLSVLPARHRVRREAPDPRLVVQPRLHVPRGRLSVVRHDHAEAGGGAGAPAVGRRPTRRTGWRCPRASCRVPALRVGRRPVRHLLHRDRRHRRRHRQPDRRRRGRGGRLRRRRHGPDRPVAEGRRGRVAPAPRAATAARSGRPRSATVGADLYLSGDILQAAGANHLGTVDPGRTIAVIDRDCHADRGDAADRRRRARPRRCSSRPSPTASATDRVVFLDAQRIAETAARQPPARQRRAARRRVPGAVGCRCRSRDDRAGHRDAGQVGRRQPRGVRVGPVGRARPRRRRRRAGRGRRAPRSGGSIFDPSPRRRSPRRAQLVADRDVPDALRELLARRAAQVGRLPERGARPSGTSTWSSASAGARRRRPRLGAHPGRRRVVVQAAHLQGRVRGRPPAPEGGLRPGRRASSASRGRTRSTYHLHPPVAPPPGPEEEAADGQAVRASPSGRCARMKRLARHAVRRRSAGTATAAPSARSIDEYEQLVTVVTDDVTSVNGGPAPLRGPGAAWPSPPWPSRGTGRSRKKPWTGGGGGSCAAGAGTEPATGGGQRRSVIVVA